MESRAINYSYKGIPFVFKSLMLFFLFWCFSFPVLASDKVNISGFVSTGVSHADKENSFLKSHYNIDHRANFLSDSVLGLQVDYRFDSKLKTSIQLLAENVQNNYQMSAEWYYLSYQYNPKLTLRAGRLRLPSYRVSETIYVGRSYVWVRPPVEVYSLFNSLTRYNGFDALYDSEMGSGLLSAQAYIGQAKERVFVVGEEIDINTHKLFGLVVNYEISDFNFRFQTSRLDVVSEDDVSGDPPNELTFVNFGLDYHSSAFGVISEFVKLSMNDFGYVGADSGSADVHGGYITFTYASGKLTPYFTYGKTEADGFYGETSGDSTSIGLRYDNSNSIATKFSIFRGNVGDQFLIMRTGTYTLDEYEEEVTIASLVFSHNF